MSPSSRRRAYAALAGITAVLFLCLAATVATLDSMQRRYLRGQFTRASQAEIDMVGRFAGGALIERRYEEAEIFLEDWARRSEDLIRLDAYGPDGLRIAEFDRGRQTPHPLALTTRVEHRGELLLQVDVVRDLSSVESEVGRSTRLFALVAGTITALLAIVIWLVVRVLAFAPMERSERRLRASEERFRSLSAAYPDLIFRLEEDGTIVDYSAPRISDLYVPPEVFLGQRMQEVLPTAVADLFEGAVARCVEKGGIEQIEYPLEVEGEDRTYEARIGPLPREQLIVVVRDVTELHRSREALLHGERLAAVGTLAAGMAHEINNPVGVMQIAAQYALALGEDADSKAEVQRTLQRIVEECQRCGRIVRSVLRFSRDESTEKWPCDFNEVVESAHDHLVGMARASRARLRLDLADSLPPIALNPTEIEQVIANLVRNSVESGAGGVEISLETRPSPAGVRFTVADDGPGMAPAARERIFEPFFTLRRAGGGTGLGLSIVHGILRDHGATIHVESSEGVGTKMVMEFVAGQGPP